MLIERVVHFNPSAIRQVFDNLTVGEDVNLQAHHIGEASGQFAGQLTRTYTVNGGLVIAQVVISQLDAKGPEDAVAIQVDQFAASEWDEKG